MKVDINQKALAFAGIRAEDSVTAVPIQLGDLKGVLVTSDSASERYVDDRLKRASPEHPIEASDLVASYRNSS